MARPKKFKPGLSKEDFTKMIQDIWSQADIQLVRATFQYNKFNKDVKTNNDIALIGKTNTELLKIVDGAINNKINVTRLVKDVVFKDDVKEDTSKSQIVTDDDKEKILDMIQEHIDNTDIDKLKEKNKEIKKPF
jgi:hypothetical protein